MKVYIDLLFLLNVWLDFCLLILVKLVLRRNAKLKNIIIASLIGGLITFIVFLKVKFILITMIKIVLSGLLVIISFGYRDLMYTFKNMAYLFMVGVIFGGIATLLKNNINNNIVYIICLIIITPLLVQLFNHQNKIIKKQYNLYYQVEVLFDNQNTLLSGFLDSGNNLRDPVTKKPIILVYKNKLKGINKIRSPMYVPVTTINKNGLIKCYKPDKLIINHKEYKNCLIGLLDNKIFMDGIDCLLNNILLEDL